MNKKAIETIASSSLVLASLIDILLLAYYATLKSKEIDALWNLPFMATWVAAPLALLAVIIYSLAKQHRSKAMVILSTVVLVLAVSLELLARNYQFIR